MGQYLNQRDNRTELQQKLDAQLRAKAAEKLKNEGERPDGIDDSAYIEGTKVTTGLDWAWLIIAVLVVAVFGYFIYIVSK
ncbi:MAG TPA: hypothetical protein VL362_02190 [Patescibacteria group bacterium]|jgi:hypothetical protein|nr:hypothetical protein [Patescibacteria group bacterium]